MYAFKWFWAIWVRAGDPPVWPSPYMVVSHSGTARIAAHHLARLFALLQRNSRHARWQSGEICKIRSIWLPGGSSRLQVNWDLGTNCFSCFLSNFDIFLFWPPFPFLLVWPLYKSHKKQLQVGQMGQMVRRMAWFAKWNEILVLK